MRKKQSYTQFLYCRVEFAIAVALFLEFDYEVKLRSDFSENQHLQLQDEIKTQVLKLQIPKENTMGDLSFMCGSLSGALKKGPIQIATKLKPYVESFEGIWKVEIEKGFLNVFFDRSKVVYYG